MSVSLTVFAGILKRAEGVRSRPYMDTTKNISIGVGHNLSVKGLSDAAIDFILDEDMNDAIKAAEAFPFFHKMNEARQTALAELCFNLEYTKLKTFTTFLQLLGSKQYSAAATDLRQTLWATQVGAARRDRICAMFREGAFQKD